MDRQEELYSLLTGQDFDAESNQLKQLEAAKQCASAYAQATNGIAVLSDFKKNVRHIYAGMFGHSLGLPGYVRNDDSAFESEIFDNVDGEELLERHILELRFFNFLKSVPPTAKTNYYASCLLHFKRQGQPSLPVFHTTRYLLCHPNGSVWMGLCTYVPFPAISGVVGCSIVNTLTGEAICTEQCDANLLSRRQKEILNLLAQGEGSKQIADKLSISVNTVSRHRQDILTRLGVTNTAAAVEIGLRMRLI